MNSLFLIRISSIALLVLSELAMHSALNADEPALNLVRGQVVDAAGNPVAGVRVGTYWSANGLKLARLKEILRDHRLKGTEIDFEELYGRIGEMEPWGNSPTQTGEDGHFEIAVRKTRTALMAIDTEGHRGGMAMFASDIPEQTVEIHLAPLVRVHGTVRVKGWDAQPDWCAVLINIPRSDACPFGPSRLAFCGTLDCHFEFFMPPGEYVFESNTGTERWAVLGEGRRVVLSAQQPDVDVGFLDLTERPRRKDLVEQSEQRGTWFNFREHYGEPAPKLYVTEARGVSKGVQVSDYKGKWVFIYFWSPWCRPCLAEGIPKVMDFYEEHADQRDRFQILSVCLDVDKEFKTLDKLDEHLGTIVRNVWRRRIEFPILLDTSFQTFESFGINGAGDMVLIDPDGNLTEGDLSTLSEVLSH